MDEDEEDYEPVLEGSELDIHLKSVNFDGLFETFSSEPKHHYPSPQDVVQVEDSVSQEKLELINSLLFSKLMLDEDASYLYSLVTTFRVKKFGPRWLEIVLPGGMFATFCSRFLLLKFKNSYVFPLLFGSICVALFVYLSDVLLVTLLFGCSMIFFHHISTYHQRIEKITRLLSTLSGISQYIKKNIRRARELSCNIITVEVTSSKDDPILEMFHERTKEQILSLKKDVILNTLNVISIARTQTDLLGKLVSKNAVLNVQLLSTLTDEQLGITNLVDCTEAGNSLDIGSVEMLKNLYYLIQSEYLKVLGICLTPLVKLTNDNVIFEEVDSSFKSLFVILEKMKLQYHSNLFPKQFRKASSVSCKKLADRCDSVRIFNSLLRALILESDNFESYLETNTNVNCSDINSTLCHIEQKLKECNECFKETNNYFLRLKGNADVKTQKQLIQLDNQPKEENKKIVQVGYSDFSVNDVDKLYLCVNDQVEESGVDTSVSEETDNITPQLPIFVLSELKSALTVKKVEFQQRELEAAKRNNIDSEQYAQFVKDESIEKDKLVAEKTVLTDTKKHKNNEAVSNLNINTYVPSNEGLSFQKMIALKAVNTSMAWNNCHDEIIYDESSSDDD